MQPLHDARAVELHGLLDDPQVGGDLLIELARSQAREHLALARSEARRRARAARPRRRSHAAPTPLPRCRADRGQQHVGLHRLGEEIGSAGLDRLDGLRDVPEAGEEDDRPDAARLGQPALQAQAVEIGQVHVEHQARRALGVSACCEELLGRAERLDAPAVRRARRRESALRTSGSSSTTTTVCGSLIRRSPASVTQKVAPRSGLLAAVSVPRCESTIERQTARPMPMPPDFVRPERIEHLLDVAREDAAPDVAHRDSDLPVLRVRAHDEAALRPPPCPASRPRRS